MTNPEIPRRNFLGLVTYGLPALAAWCGQRECRHAFQGDPGEPAYCKYCGEKLLDLLKRDAERYFTPQAKTAAERLRTDP